MDKQWETGKSAASNEAASGTPEASSNTEFVSVYLGGTVSKRVPQSEVTKVPDPIDQAYA